MSNHTWACFNCRVSVRRSAINVNAVLCPQCGGSCENLGTKIPIPPRADAKGWEDIRAHLNKLKQEWAANLAKQRAERLRHLRQQIEKLEALPDNPGRTVEFKKLQHELAALNA